MSDSRSTARKDRLIVWVAEGFGAGRIPVAPGTFGTAVGLVWVAVLLAPGSLGFFVAGALAGIPLSVWLCGAAERLLERRDPGSVVLDEIIALPVVFGAWVVLYHQAHGDLPPLGHVFLRCWPLVLLHFAAFRVFDILKPFPVHQSQSLAGGWGVTVDDVLAGLYAALVCGLLIKSTGWGL